MHPIDPVLSELIDAIAAEEPVDELVAEWLEVSARLRARVDRTIDYFADDEEQTRYQRLLGLLDDVDEAARTAALKPGDPDLMLSLASQTGAAERAVLAGRSELTMIAVAPLDALARAGTGALADRASDESVFRRVDPAQRAVLRLKNLFRPNAEAFPEPFQRGVETGFDELDRAFADFEAYRVSASRDDLERAVASLLVGGNLASLLARALAESGGDNLDFNIPLIGPLLQALDLDADPETLTLLRDEGVPQLLEMWDRSRDTWLVPALQARKLQADVEKALRTLEPALKRFEEDADGLWQSVEALDQAFSALRAHSLPIQEVLDSDFAPEAALLLSLIDGDAPLYQASAAAEAMRDGDVPPVIETLAGLLESYLDDGDKRVLLNGLELLIAEVRGRRHPA